MVAFGFVDYDATDATSARTNVACYTSNDTTGDDYNVGMQPIRLRDEATEQQEVLACCDDLLIPRGQPLGDKHNAEPRLSRRPLQAASTYG